MANVATPGFKWVKNGGRTEPPIVLMPVASAYGTAIRRGDALKRVSDGTVAVLAAGDQLAAFVCDGCERYKDGDGNMRPADMAPASTTYTGTTSVLNPLATVVRCIPVAGQLFEVDCDTGAATQTAAQDLVGNNADMVATAGSNHFSGHVLNTASGTGTGSAQFRIESIVVLPGGKNDVTAANWKVIVSANESTSTPYTTTGV
jgi:hypothetical protein